MVLLDLKSRKYYFETQKERKSKKRRGDCGSWCEEWIEERQEQIEGAGSCLQQFTCVERVDGVIQGKAMQVRMQRNG